MMLRVVLPAALILTAALALAADSDKEVEKLLASMRTAYSTATSASLQVISKFENEGKTETQNVTLHYSKPSLLRVVFGFKGHIITRVSDGKKVYTAGESGEPFETKYSIDAVGLDLPVNLESLCFFDWKRQLSTSKGSNMEHSKFKLIESERWNNRSWIVLEETAHGQNVFVRYFIDPTSFMIWRCEVKSLDKKRFIMETQVEKLVLNQKLDQGLFKAPKKGG